MSTTEGAATEQQDAQHDGLEAAGSAGGGESGGRHRGAHRERAHLRLVPDSREARGSAATRSTGRSPQPEGSSARQCDEAGTTTAEYTVVTGAAVAFGALLFKLLTSSWGDKILSTAFKQVISLLGF